MAFNNLPTADAAGHVPVCTSEWWWARAGAGRLYLHVSCGAEQCQWGLGVWHFARHRAVGPAARELHQPRRWVWHMGRPWVRKSITMLFFSPLMQRWNQTDCLSCECHTDSPKVMCCLPCLQCNISKLLCLCLILRSHSILNCASPSISSSTVSGLLFDEKLNDNLLDSLMDPSSLTGLCPPMQVLHVSQLECVDADDIQEIEITGAKIASNCCHLKWILFSGLPAK